jgi:hypothetical protein
MYTDFLLRLRDAVRRKHPEKWRNKSWFLLHDNAPAHRSVLVKDFLKKKKKSDNTEASPIPNLVPADF